MARTFEGEALTAAHRRAQLALRAQVLIDFQRVWPLWRGDERTFRRLVEATVPLVGMHHRTSSGLAAGYLDMFRAAERAGGSATPRLGRALDPDRIETSLRVTGLISVRDSIAAGFSPQAARQNAFVKVSGAITRHALSGGRDTITTSVQADRRARGWARVTSGTPCAFCATLALNGAVYSEYTVDFEAHDHCSCSAEPVYDGSRMPPNSERLKDLYNEATREARDAGELDRGTDNDLLNAFRRKLNETG